jgi:hypothetical protein
LFSDPEIAIFCKLKEISDIVRRRTCVGRKSDSDD